MIPALLSRKYDGIIAAMSITDERRKKVDFTEKYARIPNRFVAAKGTELTLTPEWHGEASIEVQRATTHDKVPDRQLYSNVTHSALWRKADEAYLDPVGRVPACIADAPTIDQGYPAAKGATSSSMGQAPD